MFSYGEGTSVFSGQHCARTSKLLSPSVMDMSNPTALEGMAGMFSYAPGTVDTARQSTTGSKEQDEIVFLNGALSAPTDEEEERVAVDPPIEPILPEPSTLRARRQRQPSGGLFSSLRSTATSSTAESSVKTHQGKMKGPSLAFATPIGRSLTKGRSSGNESLSSRIPYLSRSRQPQQYDQDQSSGSRQSLQQRLIQSRRNHHKFNHAAHDEFGEADDDASGLLSFQQPQAVLSEESSWNVEDELRLQQLTTRIAPPAANSGAVATNVATNYKNNAPAIRNKNDAKARREKILRDIFTDSTSEGGTTETGTTRTGGSKTASSAETVQSKLARLAKLRGSKYLQSPLRRKFHPLSSKQEEEASANLGASQDIDPATVNTQREDHNPTTEQEQRRQRQQRLWQKHKRQTPPLPQPSSNDTPSSPRKPQKLSTSELSHMISDRLHHLSHLYNQRKKTNAETAQRKPGAPSSSARHSKTKSGGNRNLLSSRNTNKSETRQVQVEEDNDVVEVVRVPSSSTPATRTDASLLSLVSSSGLQSPPTIVHQVPQGEDRLMDKGGPAYTVFERAVQAGNQHGAFALQQQKPQQAFGLGAAWGQSAFVPVGAVPMNVEASAVNQQEQSLKGKEILSTQQPFDLISPITANTDQFAPHHLAGLNPQQQRRQQPTEDGRVSPPRHWLLERKDKEKRKRTRVEALERGDPPPQDHILDNIRHDIEQLTQASQDRTVQPSVHDTVSIELSAEYNQTLAEERVFDTGRGEMQRPPRQKEFESQEVWYSKEGDQPIAAEKESREELQKLRDALRKILQIEPRMRREIEFDELLQGDMHTDEELTHVLSGLAGEHSVKALMDPDGVMATNLGDLSATLLRLRKAKGKLDPEEQRYKRRNGRMREPEGERTIPTTNDILRTLKGMSPSILSSQHNDGSSQSRPIVVSDDQESPEHGGLFHKVGGVYTPARYKSSMGRAEHFACPSNHAPYHHEEIMFVDESERDGVFAENERDDWEQLTRAGQELRDGIQVASDGDREDNFHGSRNASRYERSAAHGNREGGADTSTWQQSGPHKNLVPIHTTGEPLQMYNMSALTSRAAAISRDFVSHMYGFALQDKNERDILSDGPSGPLDCGSESIPSVVFAKDLSEESERPVQSSKNDEKQQVVAEQRQDENLFEDERASGSSRASSGSDCHVLAGDEQEKFELEQAILQLRSRRMTTSAYKKVMMGLRKVNISNSMEEKSGGNDSIDRFFFKKAQVSSSEFDRVVEALSEVQVLPAVTPNVETTPYLQDTTITYSSTGLDPETDTECKKDPPDIGQCATMSSMVCVKGVRSKNIRKSSHFTKSSSMRAFASVDKQPRDDTNTTSHSTPQATCDQADAAQKHNQHHSEFCKPSERTTRDPPTRTDSSLPSRHVHTHSRHQQKKCADPPSQILRSSSRSFRSNSVASSMTRKATAAVDSKKKTSNSNPGTPTPLSPASTSSFPPMAQWSCEESTEVREAVENDRVIRKSTSSVARNAKFELSQITKSLEALQGLQQPSGEGNSYLKKGSVNRKVQENNFISLAGDTPIKSYPNKATVNRTVQQNNSISSAEDTPVKPYPKKVAAKRKVQQNDSMSLADDESIKSSPKKARANRTVQKSNSVSLADDESIKSYPKKVRANTTVQKNDSISSVDEEPTKSYPKKASAKRKVQQNKDMSLADDKLITRIQELKDKTEQLRRRQNAQQKKMSPRVKPVKADLSMSSSHDVLVDETIGVFARHNSPQRRVDKVEASAGSATSRAKRNPAVSEPTLASASEETSAVVFEEGMDEVIPWSGADGVEIILSQATDLESYEGLESFPGSMEPTSTEQSLTGEDDTSSSSESITRSTDQLLGMVLQVREDDNSASGDDTATDRDDGGKVVSPFAEFPKHSKNLKRKQNRGKAASTRGSFSTGTKSMLEPACSETTDSVRNIEIGRSFPRSSREDRKQNRATYQAKVDLFKRKLEVASKYSIVGKEIVPRKSGDSDGNFRRGNHEANVIPRCPGSKRESTKETEPIKSIDATGRVASAHEGDLVKKTFSQDGTAENSTLIGDVFVDSDCDQEKIHDKIKVVKEDIDNVRARLQNQKKKKSSKTKSTNKKQKDRLLAPAKKQEETDEDSVFDRELVAIQTDSFSLPTCFEPKNNGKNDTMLTRRLNKAFKKKCVSKSRDSVNTPSAGSSRHRGNVVMLSRSELSKPEQEAVEAAERAEQRVREGLEKMKKGLADNKKVKLTLEKHRKKQAADSPKPKKTTTSIFDGFSGTGSLFSWFPKKYDVRVSE